MELHPYQQGEILYCVWIIIRGQQLHSRLYANSPDEARKKFKDENPNVHISDVIEIERREQ